MEHYVIEPPGTDPLVESILPFAKSVCGAQSAIFYWATDCAEIESLVCFNVPGSLYGQYMDPQIDPLNLQRLNSRRAEVAFLNLEPPADRAGVAAFHRMHGFGDEADLVFWHQGRVIGGISLLKSLASRPFHADDCDWLAMQRHFELSLAGHGRVRSRAVAQRLKDGYKLTDRELQVLRLISTGASNADIVGHLNVSMATAKTHIVNILAKLKVGSRAAAAAVAAGLCTPTDAHRRPGAAVACAPADACAITRRSPPRAR